MHQILKTWFDFMPTKILSRLKASASEGVEATDSRGVLQQVHSEVSPGQFVVTALGRDGLTLRCGNDKVIVPLTELLELAAQNHPSFVPRKSKEKLSA
jgi:hypothetical protein